MKIDRLLFLGLTATITAGAAGCASGTTPNVFDDAHATASAPAPRKPGSAAEGTATAGLDVKPTSVLGAYRPVAKSGMPAGDGPADPGGEPDPEPSDPGSGDAGPSDPGPSDAGAGDAYPGDAYPGDAYPGDAGPLMAGPIDEVCPPFTSELRELTCRASYQTGVKPAVRTALLLCASAADIPSCVLGALALGSTGSFGIDPLCAPLNACATAPWLSAFQCSQALAGLDPDGVALVQAELDTSCDATASSFVRTLLIDLQP